MPMARSKPVARLVRRRAMTAKVSTFASARMVDSAAVCIRTTEPTESAFSPWQGIRPPGRSGSRWRRRNHPRRSYLGFSDASDGCFCLLPSIRLFPFLFILYVRVEISRPTRPVKFAYHKMRVSSLRNLRHSITVLVVTPALDERKRQ